MRLLSMHATSGGGSERVAGLQALGGDLQRAAGPEGRAGHQGHHALEQHAVTLRRRQGQNQRHGRGRR